MSTIESRSGHGRPLRSKILTGVICAVMFAAGWQIAGWALAARI